MPSKKKTLRAAIYARYSSDVQREASIEDQLRVCKARRQGGMAGCRELHGSGGLGRQPDPTRHQKLLQDAAAGKFEIVLTDSLDRVSRDLEDIAHTYKRL